VLSCNFYSNSYCKWSIQNKELNANAPDKPYHYGYISYLTTFTLPSAVKTGSEVDYARMPTVVQISYYNVHLLSQPLSSFIIKVSCWWQSSFRLHFYTFTISSFLLNTVLLEVYQAKCYLYDTKQLSLPEVPNVI
jgi:hypothetical protein